MNSLAIDDHGRLFSTFRQVLVQVDPYSLALKPIVSLSYAVAGLNTGTQPTGMAFLPDGELVSVDRDGLAFTDSLFRIDVGSGVVTKLGNIGFAVVQDLACSPSGKLYAWSLNSGLLTIDPKTGVGTDVNPNDNPKVDIQALAFGADGTLYGAQNALFRIDLNSGSAVEIGAGGFDDVRGLALIPEPTVVALMSLGLPSLLHVLRIRSKRSTG